MAVPASRSILRDTINLYHITWGSFSLCKDEPIYPHIPQNPIEGENNSIQRICTAPSLDDCLTALGPTFIGLNVLHELSQACDNGIVERDVTLPFTMFQFAIDRKNPALMFTGKVAKYVPDAFWTQECWITEPIVPFDSKHLWLVDGKVSEDRILFKGKHDSEPKRYRYYVITDGQWSSVKQKATPEFIKSSIAVTKEWLTQRQDICKDQLSSESPKVSLVSRIKSTSTRVAKSQSSFNVKAKEPEPEL